MASRSDGKEKPHGRDILAGDLQRGWDATSRLPERVEGYCNLKEKTEEFTDWARDGGVPLWGRKDQKLFRKVESCGSYLIFRNYLRSNRSRLLGACSCKEHLLCAFCAARRGVRNAVAYKERVEVVKGENPELGLFFVTFTVKNGPDLWERFSHLRSSMQSFLKRRNDSLRRDTPSSFNLVSGGVFTYEFKRGAGSGVWHPHIHMLVLIPSAERFDIEAVKAEWLQITGDSSVVNIKPCFGDAVFLEVFAYALKFSDMDHADRWHAFGLLKGERLISSFGSLRGVEVPESLNDDLLDTDEPWVDMLFRYRRNHGYSEGEIVGRSDPVLDKGAFDEEGVEFRRVQGAYLL